MSRQSLKGPRFRLQSVIFSGFGLVRLKGAFVRLKGVLVKVISRKSVENQGIPLSLENIGQG